MIGAEIVPISKQICPPGQFIDLKSIPKGIIDKNNPDTMDNARFCRLITLSQKK
jgi:hypothetical protein